MRTIIIKLGFVGDEKNGQRVISLKLNKAKLVFDRGELQTFKDEVNIQTDLFLKTISYLQPICPAIVYSNLYNGTGMNDILEKMYMGSENKNTTILLKSIYDSKMKGEFYNIGLIAMEFADSYTLLHNLVPDTNFELYKNMSLYLLLKLAIETGYTHGDFHPGNIFINTSSTNYFKGITGKPLLIDFGQSQKIPLDILEFMKDQYKNGNYTEALKKLCDIDRPDEIKMKEYPSFYGFACGTYDYKSNKLVDGFPLNTNKEIGDLILKREKSIDDMVDLFKRKHDSEPGKFPLLPLSNAVKNSMYAGLIEGGKRKSKKLRKNNKIKSRKNSNSKSRKNSNSKSRKNIKIKFIKQ